MNRLRQMTIFAHIVEAGSISAAATRLALSKSVISQHLKTLETDLGVTLIKRTTRRRVLTDAGELFYKQCKTINNMADSAWDTVQQHLVEPQGRFRITAPNALMETLVTPVIAELMTAYPKLKPELISADNHLDFMEHDIDLAIRVGPSHDSNIKQKRIGEFRDILCALENNPKEIDSLPYIANSWQRTPITHIFQSNNRPEVIYKKEAHCIANSFYSCLSLIKSGVGIGLIPDFYQPLIKPKIINIFPCHQLPKNTVYALTPYIENPPLSVKICSDAIEAQLQNLTKVGD